MLRFWNVLFRNRTYGAGDGPSLAGGTVWVYAHVVTNAWVRPHAVSVPAVQEGSG